MSKPNYKTFSEDLNVLKEQMQKLEAELNTALEGKKLSEAAKQMYEEMKLNFQRIHKSFETLENPQTEQTAQNKAWLNLSADVENVDLTTMPVLQSKREFEPDQEYEKRVTEHNRQMTKLLDDENVGQIWHACQKMKNLSNLTTQIRQKEDYEKLKQSIVQHGEAQADCHAELLRFTDPYEKYDTFEELKAKQREALEKYQAADAAYQQYHSDKYAELLKKLDENVNKIDLQIIKGKAVLQEKAKRADQKVAGVKKELQAADADIQKEKELQEEQDQQARDMINEVEKGRQEEQKLKEKSAELEANLTEVQQMKETAVIAAKGLQEGLEDLENTDLKQYKDDPARQKAKEAEIEMVHILRMKAKAEQLLDERRDEMQAAGLSEYPEDVQKKMLERGRQYAKGMGSKLLEQAVRDNESIRKDVRMKEIHEKYLQKLQDTWEVDQETLANVNGSPVALKARFEGICGFYNQRSDELMAAAEKSNLGEAEKAIHKGTLGLIAENSLRLKNYQNSIEAYSEKETNLLAQKQENDKKLKDLKALNDLRAKRIVNNNHGNAVKQLEEKKEEILEKLETAKEESKKVGEEFTELLNSGAGEKEKKVEAHRNVEISESNREFAREKFDKLDGQVDKVNQFIQKQNQLVKSRQALNQRLNPTVRTDADVTVKMRNRTCETIVEELKRFRETAGYGKDAGHKDGVHYTAMMRELDELLGKNGEEAKLLSAESLKERLEKIGAAAKAYRDTRAKDIFKRNSTIRRTRTAYTNRLIDFAADSMQRIDDVLASEQSLQTEVKKLNRYNLDMPMKDEDLFEKIRQAAPENRRRELREEQEKKLAEKEMTRERTNEKVQDQERNREIKPKVRGMNG